LSLTTHLYTSTSELDYAPNLQQCATDGNALCIGVGFLMADAISNAAAIQPGTKFALADNAFETSPGNLRGITFAEDEAGYLAGVLAGSMSQSDVVGVVGGMKIPPVVRFAEGFRNGAQCANPSARGIISYTNTFVDPDLGAQTAQQMLAQGADVIFGAAGATGNGAVLTATQSGKWGIGVDTDQYVQLFISGTVPGSNKLLSSAMKRLDNAVYDTIQDTVSGTFTSGTVLYNLAVDGVGLAPFHETNPFVPASVRNAIDAAKQGISSGSIDVNDDCRYLVGFVASGPTVNDPVGYSFDWLAYQGLVRAQTHLSITGQVYTSVSSADYEPNLQQCANDGNDLCIGVSFLMIDALSNTAAANNATKFAGVDMSLENPPPNLRGMTFAEDETGYLAGVLAGKMTTNDKVGVVGGMQIPPVVRFAEGYRNGAQCANGQARVVINYTGTFVDPELGAQTAQQMMAQGSDVIFGAAGATGNGAILTATQSSKWAIGVDSDQYVTLFGNGSVAGANKLLSSALKRVDNATYDTIADAISGTFTPGNVVYGLLDDGVGLAPFHRADPAVPQSVRNAIEAARQGIINGTIDVNEDCRVDLYLPLIKR
jgi:basic membrane protein A